MHEIAYARVVESVADICDRRYPALDYDCQETARTVWIEIARAKQPLTIADISEKTGWSIFYVDKCIEALLRGKAPIEVSQLESIKGRPEKTYCAKDNE